MVDKFIRTQQETMHRYYDYRSNKYEHITARRIIQNYWMYILFGNAGLIYCLGVVFWYVMVILNVGM